MNTKHQINDNNRKIVKSVYPDAYYDPVFNAVFFFDGKKDSILAKGDTSNLAWMNAAEKVSCNA